jgi:hypothetical protein
VEVELIVPAQQYEAGLQNVQQIQYLQEDEKVEVEQRFVCL